MSKWLFFPFLLFIFLACSNETTEKEKDGIDSMKNEKPTKVETVFETNIDYLRLREKEGKSGKIIDVLPARTKLIATGQVSEHRTEEVLRGIRFNEPWVEVKTKNGKVGWVFGGALKFSDVALGTIGQKLLRQRLDYYFGEELGKQIYEFKDSFEKKQTGDEFAALYNKSTEIVTAANKVLEKRVLVDEKTPIPDFSWVVNRLPGHIVHKLSQNGTFHIFRDFRVFADKSKTTLGKIDDAFFNLCLKIFDVDSIEYIIPGWQMDVPQIGIVSLLGKGTHYDVLNKMNNILTGSKLFEKEINAYKSLVMEDLLNESATYWYSKDKVLKELDSIISAEFGILTKNDLIALKTRRDRIDKAEENGIVVNLRAGM